MAYITRGFIAEIVDGRTPAATVIATLGQVVIPIFQKNAGVTISGGEYSPGVDATQAWISTYIADPGMVGGWCLFNNYQGKDEAMFARVTNNALAIAPIGRIFDASGAFGTRYVRLRNATGKYFVSNVLNQNGSFTLDAFNEDGTYANFGILGYTGYEYNLSKIDLNLNGSFIVDSLNDGEIGQIDRFYTIQIQASSQTSSSQVHNRYALSRNTTSSTVIAFKNFFNGTTPFPPAVTDPYANLPTPGDDPIPGGDTIPEPGLPGLSAASTGIMGLFCPSVAQMQQLADFMWTDFGGQGTTVIEVLEEIVEAIKRAISNPLDYIFGLNIIPSQGLSVGASKVVKFGFVSSGVSMPMLSDHYFIVDCGSISFDVLCGDSFLDYAPYSKFSIYLPYIGFKDIDPNDCVGHTISVKYHGDAITGGLTAYVFKDGNVMYQYSGGCALNVPLSSDNWGATIASAASIATGVIAAAAVPGAAGVAAAGKTLLKSSAANVASNPSLLSPQVMHSGAVSGAPGFMGVQYPFIVREAVNFHSTAGFNKESGYPAYYYKELSDVTGFTTVLDPHINNIPQATQGEIDEIISLLESGVIL